MISKQLFKRMKCIGHVVGSSYENMVGIGAEVTVELDSMDLDWTYVYGRKEKRMKQRNSHDNCRLVQTMNAR